MSIVSKGYLLVLLGLLAGVARDPVLRYVYREEIERHSQLGSEGEPLERCA